MAAAHQVAVKAAVVAKVMPVVETVDSVAVAKVVERVEAAVAMEMPAVAKVATAVEIAEMHLAIRRWLNEAGFAQTEILYGGSVKPGNAAEIFTVPNVDGALVGGASLVAADFASICAAAASFLALPERRSHRAK